MLTAANGSIFEGEFADNKMNGVICVLENGKANYEYGLFVQGEFKKTIGEKAWKKEKKNKGN